VLHQLIGKFPLCFVLSTTLFASGTSLATPAARVPSVAQHALTKPQAPSRTTHTHTPASGMPVTSHHILAVLRASSVTSHVALSTDDSSVAQPVPAAPEHNCGITCCTCSQGAVSRVSCFCGATGIICGITRQWYDMDDYQRCRV
jgi:hypothetical protein